MVRDVGIIKDTAILVKISNSVYCCICQHEKTNNLTPILLKYVQQFKSYGHLSDAKTPEFYRKWSKKAKSAHNGYKLSIYLGLVSKRIL